MSYYRYITGIYKSYWPELNKPLRSRSAPRHIPEAVPSRISKASSVPPASFYSTHISSLLSGSGTPFRDRLMSSMPRQLSYSYDNRYIVTPPQPTRVESVYSDFDCKVMDYMAKLEREDTVRTTVKQYIERPYRSSYSINTATNYYGGMDSNSYGLDYLYPSTNDILGSWKHYNLSRETLDYRNTRAKSPLVTRELTRYYGKKPNYIGDLTSCASFDFRHYNYRRVPYFGGSDDYQFMKHKMFRGGRNI